MSLSRSSQTHRRRISARASRARTAITNNLRVYVELESQNSWRRRRRAAFMKQTTEHVVQMKVNSMRTERESTQLQECITQAKELNRTLRSELRTKLARVRDLQEENTKKLAGFTEIWRPFWEREGETYSNAELEAMQELLEESLEKMEDGREKFEQIQKDIERHERNLDADQEKLDGLLAVWKEPRKTLEELITVVEALERDQQASLPCEAGPWLQDALDSISIFETPWVKIEMQGVIRLK